MFSFVYFHVKRFLLTFLVRFAAPFILSFWFKCLRFTATGGQFPQKGIIVFWHQHIFSAIGFLSRYSRRQNITALVSGSEDGVLLQLVLKALHFKVVEGSSTEGGFASLLYLERNMNGDDTLLITPDGPKGPSGVMKPGALHLAIKTEKPLTAIRVIYDKFWQLQSWDRAILPKPFSKCEIIFSDPLKVGREQPGFETDEIIQKIESNLHGHQTDR